MAPPEITVADPDEPGVRALVELHLALGRDVSPPEDAHSLDVAGLEDPAITLFAAREGDEVLALGAMKELDGAHGELKTMHTAAAARGRGIARTMLGLLLTEARRRGYRRVSLETGSMDEFEPARSLYRAAGFVPCPPFAGYHAGPNSVYFALDL